ncbi:MAG: 2-amino-4-hydroxy-6-hydroxymethyldihydropteridine diphosphokinase [Steroidobacteraceae bacterium]
MTAVYIAVGSNVAPEHNIQRAVAALAGEFPGSRFSPWYRNRAAGFEGDDFINLVAGFDSTLAPLELRERLHAIEAQCGRARDAPRWAPRSMDLDVLLYGELVCVGPPLTLPRPDLLKRAYMLGPLADLAPDLRHPTAGKTIAQLGRAFAQAAHPLERSRSGGSR